MFPLDTFLRELTHLPHRGAATPCESEAAQLLENYLTQMEADVQTELFRTPKTYVTVVYWLLGGLVFGLLLVPYLTVTALVLVWLFVVLAWLFFNWRYSPVTRFPLQHMARNVIGRWPAQNNQKPVSKVILMAHYDTAPVSLLYTSSLVGNFRGSMILSLGLMVASALGATLEVLGWGLPYVTYLRYGCMGYFAVQAVLATAGYWLYGYTNGASDNATGVAAALAVADRLRQANIPHMDLEVVLTSAEEAGMIGSQHYVQEHRSDWPAGRTAVINFDTLGAGKLTLIEKTGTIEPILYDNPLTQLARRLIEQENFQHHVQTGEWHTADFDSIWLVRAGVPVITLCALDENKQMPRIHRRDDTLAAVELEALTTAVDFAGALAYQWTTVRQLTAS
ncbi:M28 family peptidase [Nibrella saemangeumensis]|uniref:M28 family peptidase n=1 Tax=Nibrella saemangeumensis TaxID=1084526 RepID=A0ABP8MK82_9BACT